MHSATHLRTATTSQRGTSNRGRARLRLLAVGLGLLVATAALQHVVAAPAYGETVTRVQPSADAYVSSAAPNQNHGSSKRLVAKAYKAAFYLRLSIPAGAVVDSAVLKLDRYAASSTPGTLTATAVSGGWTESTLTWNNRPGRSATAPFVTAADDGQSDSVELDLTKLVTPGKELNLILTTTAGSSTIFSSKESTAPELTITTGENRLSNGCRYSERGLPECGVYVGAAYGSNTDPTSWETGMSQNLGVRRTFYSAKQVDKAVANAKADLAAGRLPWISFKLPTDWASMAEGDGDAWARDLVSKLDALDGPVWLAFHHEPEGDGTIEDWVAMQRHLSPIVRNADNVAFTLILTGWHELYHPDYSLDRMWPGDGLVDVVGFDIYWSFGEVKGGVRNTKATDIDQAYFKPIDEWADRHGVAWGLAETGLTDYAAQRYPNWMPDTVKALQNRGAVSFSYFNTPVNSADTWPITTADKQAQYLRALQAGAELR